MREFIVFEGVDGSGKGTQAELLMRALVAIKRPATPFAFPRYETPTGQVVAACLRGAHGNFLDWPAQLAALPFALDRFEARNELIQALQSGVVVCDRYVHSNVAHQAAKVHGVERNVTINWIEAFEHQTLALPRPDLVIWLDMPVARAFELAGKRAVRDQHEGNPNYQREVATVYRQLAERASWLTVKCSPTSIPRKPEQIHDEIVEKLKQRFPQLFRATI